MWTRRDAGLAPPTPRVRPELVEPNRTHHALVQIERLGKATFLIFQNVDGLQLASGFPGAKLAELHGNSRLMVCSGCETKFTRIEAKWDRDQWGPGYRGFVEEPGQPGCPICGGRLYSSIVNFGDNLPVEDLEASFQHARQCDLFVVVGSSLVVSPAADIPGEAQRAGARVVICNLGATPYDDSCDLLLSAPVGDVMNAVLQAVENPDS